MIFRVLNFVVIGALVLAAAYVYRIKFDSTVQAERLAKLRGEVRHERDDIAALRAEWGQLDNPARIETLAKRYSPAQAHRAAQFDSARSPARTAAAKTARRQRRSDRRHDRESGTATGDASRRRPAAPPARGQRRAGRQAERRDARKRERRTNGGTRQPATRRPKSLAALALAQLALRHAMSIAPPRRGRGSGWRSSPSPPSIASSPRGWSCSRSSPTATALHRVVSGDAIATARPDILDRNGEILATDVRVPSLYAEPRRLIDVDEAVELLTADLPDLDATELRERLSSKRGFVWLKRDITPEQQREIYRQGLPGIGFLNENKRDYPNGPEVSHLLGHVNIDNQGIAGMEKWLDGQGLAALHMAGLATDRLQTPVQLARRSARATCDARRARRSARRNSRRSRPPASCSTCAPARSSPWCRSRTTTRTIRTRRSIRRASTG